MTSWCLEIQQCPTDTHDLRESAGKELGRQLNMLFTGNGKKWDPSPWKGMTNKGPKDSEPGLQLDRNSAGLKLTFQRVLTTGEIGCNFPSETLQHV